MYVRTAQRIEIKAMESCMQHAKSTNDPREMKKAKKERQKGKRGNSKERNISPSSGLLEPPRAVLFNLLVSSVGA
ncbi:hypothetical protein M407DRAFT_246575 [Tulasnella calospora MUT 4182]|uniref:Uncharacterized protein n=1 Tax=Tulasnella calospora MUT 4182 TaxID=1051891 RepID=A0A0C3PTI6_9AGAM|nr:hypothetical protein M407DRAFT_246575 [Tulasnella calospora MUT 4182]